MKKKEAKFKESQKELTEAGKAFRVWDDETCSWRPITQEEIDGLSDESITVY